jgi:hypothetical protein
MLNYSFQTNETGFTKGSNGSAMRLITGEPRIRRDLIVLVVLPSVRFDFLLVLRFFF